MGILYDQHRVPRAVTNGHILHSWIFIASGECLRIWTSSFSTCPGTVESVRVGLGLGQGRDWGGEEGGLRSEGGLYPPQHGCWYPIIALICLLGSIWTCTSYISGRSRLLWAGGDVLDSPPQDAGHAPVALLHQQGLYRIGLSYTHWGPILSKLWLLMRLQCSPR